MVSRRRTASGRDRGHQIAHALLRLLALAATIQFVSAAATVTVSTVAWQAAGRRRLLPGWMGWYGPGPPDGGSPWPSVHRLIVAVLWWISVTTASKYEARTSIAQPELDAAWPLTQPGFWGGSAGRPAARAARGGGGRVGGADRGVPPATRPRPVGGDRPGRGGPGRRRRHGHAAAGGPPHGHRGARGRRRPARQRGRQTGGAGACWRRGGRAGVLGGGERLGRPAARPPAGRAAGPDRVPRRAAGGAGGPARRAGVVVGVLARRARAAGSDGAAVPTWAGPRHAGGGAGRRAGRAADRRDQLRRDPAAGHGRAQRVHFTPAPANDRSPCRGRYSPSAPRPSGCSPAPWRRPSFCTGAPERPRFATGRTGRPRRSPPPTPPRRQAARTTATATAYDGKRGASPGPGPRPARRRRRLAAALAGAAACWCWRPSLGAVDASPPGPPHPPAGPGTAWPPWCRCRRPGGRLAGHAAARGVLRPGQAQDDRRAVGCGHVLAAGGAPAGPAVLRRTGRARGRGPDPAADRPFQPGPGRRRRR